MIGQWTSDYDEVSFVRSKDAVIWNWHFSWSSGQSLKLLMWLTGHGRGSIPYPHIDR